MNPVRTDDAMSGACYITMRGFLPVAVEAHSAAGPSDVIRLNRGPPVESKRDKNVRRSECHGGSEGKGGMYVNMNCAVSALGRGARVFCEEWEEILRTRLLRTMLLQCGCQNMVGDFGCFCRRRVHCYRSTTSSCCHRRDRSYGTGAEVRGGHSTKTKNGTKGRIISL